MRRHARAAHLAPTRERANARRRVRFHAQRAHALRCGCWSADAAHSSSPSPSLLCFPSPPLFLSISRGAAARAQCAAAVLCTMLMLDDTRASECGVRARIRSSTHLLREGTTGCRRLSLVTLQAKTLSINRCLPWNHHWVLLARPRTSAAIKLNYELEVLKLLFRD